MESEHWSPKFGDVANTIDKHAEELSGTSEEVKKVYKTYGRPYLISTGFEDGMKYIFTMSPLMNKLADSAEFMQCDITYTKTREYPYLFNAVVFNDR